MARKRASMREGPLAELFRATEAAQRQAEKEGRAVPGEPLEETVEHPPPKLEVAPDREIEDPPRPDRAPPAPVQPQPPGAGERRSAGCSLGWRPMPGCAGAPAHPEGLASGSGYRIVKSWVCGLRWPNFFAPATALSPRFQMIRPRRMSDS